MSTLDPGIEAQIREWRSYLLRRNTVDHVDIDELEDHLRSQISELGAAGLSGDESFLVALKRMGGVNELSREFARERSSRLWKQLVLAGDTIRDRPDYIPLFITICFAIGAAVVFKLPALFGVDPFGAENSESANAEADARFYLRNASLLVLPFLIRGRRLFTDLERWQTAYIPVYAAWAAIVVVVFPPLFGFD